MGWYVDGEWNIHNKELNFLNFKEKAFLLSNNLKIHSAKIFFNFQFSIKRDLTAFRNKRTLIEYDEVFVFNFSPSLYPIR